MSGIIAHGSSDPLHLQACGSSNDPHLGRAHHRNVAAPATAAVVCTAYLLVCDWNLGPTCLKRCKDTVTERWWREVLHVHNHTSTFLVIFETPTPQSLRLANSTIYASTLSFKLKISLRGRRENMFTAPSHPSQTPSLGSTEAWADLRSLSCGAC
jgi:hypothetical protein